MNTNTNNAVNATEKKKELPEFVAYVNINPMVDTPDMMPPVLAISEKEDPVRACEEGFALGKTVADWDCITIQRRVAGTENYKIIYFIDKDGTIDDRTAHKDTRAYPIWAHLITWPKDA